MKHFKNMLWDYNWNAKIVVAIYIHTDSNNVPYPVISVRIKLSLSLSLSQKKVNKQYNPSDCVWLSEEAESQLCLGWRCGD